MLTFDKNPSTEPKLFDAPQAILDDIGGADNTKYYIALKEQIAKIEYALNQSKGFFWKKSAINEVERAQLEANLDILRIALDQVVEEMGRQSPEANKHLSTDSVYVTAHVRSRPQR